MFLSKHKTGIYYLFFYQEGIRKSVSTKTASKKEANEFLRSFIIPEKKAPGKQNGQSVSNSIRRYLIHCETRLQPKTIADLKSEFKQFIGYTGADTNIHEINKERISGYIDRRIMVSKHTGAKAQRYLSTFFKYLVEIEIIGINPMEKLKRVKTDKTEPEYFTEEQFNNFLVHISESEILKPLFVYAFYSGCRLKEIVSLKFEHINLQKGTIEIGKDFRTKSGKSRIIPILPEIKEVIINQYKLNKSVWVFSTATGEQLKGDYVSKNFKKHIKHQQLNNRLHFHSLRHSGASYLLRCGLSVFHTSRILGHSSTAITEQVYSHHTTEDLIKAVSKINL